MIDLGTKGRKFRKNKVQVGYFNASVINLNGFEYGKKVCELCQNERLFFTLNPNSFSSPDWICIECLQIIKIEHVHDSELGLVDKNLPEELQEESAKKHVTKESFEELTRTPPFLNLQGGVWLGHCEEFMDYIGTWEAPDFTKQSKTGNGKQLFLEMTAKEDHHLWDDFSIKDNETINTWEDCLYHTFECRKCKVKRGRWDMG